MDSEKSGFQSIDEYIASFPQPTQELLQKVCETVKAAAPKAKEKISYSMPAFELHGNLVYFGAAKNHIGFYPTPSAIKAFKDDLATYKGAAGSVQFPFDQPLPLDLITKMVKFRVDENLKKHAAKSKKKK